MLSDRIIQTLELQNVVTGDKEAEAFLKRRATLLKTIETYTNSLLRKDRELSSSASKSAKTKISNAERELQLLDKQIRAYHEQIRLQEQINRARSIKPPVSPSDRAEFERQRQIGRLTGQTQQDLISSLKPEELAAYHINRFKQVFRRVFDALASFIIVNSISRIFTGFAKSLIDSNAQLEVLNARLRSVGRGDSSFAELRKHIMALTIETPFMVRQFADAAVTLEAFGKSAIKYLGPIADWASAIGRDVEDVALAFAKISTGSPRTALLLTTRGITKTEFDAEVRKVGDAATALRNVIERNYGDMAKRVSRTFEGMIANVKDVWFMLSATLGAGIFVKIRSDLEWLFNVLKKGTTEGGASLTIFSQGLAVLYDVLKSEIIPIISTLIVFSLPSIIRGIKATASAIESLVVGGAKASGWAIAFMILVMPLIQIFQDLAAANKKATEAIREQAEALDKYGKSSQQYADALYKQIDAIHERTTGLTGAARLLVDVFKTGFNSFKSFKDMFLALGAMRRGDFSKVMSLLKGGDVTTDIRLAASHQSAAEYYQQQSQRIKALSLIKEQTAYRMGMPASMAMDLQKLMQSKFGGENFTERLLGAIDKKSQENAVARIIASKNRPTLDTGTGVLSEDVKAARFEQAKKFLKALLTISPDEIRRLALKEQTQPQTVALAAQGLGESANVADAYKALIDELAAEEAKTGKQKEDLTARILALEEERRQLLDGHSKKQAELNQQKSLEESATKDIQKYEKGSYEWQKERVKQLEAGNKVLQLHRSIQEEMSDAQLRKLEAQRDLEKSLIDLKNKGLEYEFLLSGDISAMNKERRDNLAEINGLIQSNALNIKAQALANQKLLDDDPERVRGEAQIAEMLTKQNGLMTKRLQILTDIANQTSENFSQAFAKSAREMRNSLVTFYDDVAKMTLDETVNFGKGLFDLLIYGDSSNASKEEKVAELKDQLNQLYMERDRQLGITKMIGRAEDESNAQYVERLNAWRDFVSAAQQSYEYQTKEMQLLEEINKLESERNNIIFDRLAALGEKVFDKFLDNMLSGFVSSIFTKSLDYTGHPVGPEVTQSSVNSGPTIVFQGNNIYGEADFTNMVDTAMEKINRRRRG